MDTALKRDMEKDCKRLWLEMNTNQMEWQEN